MKTELEGFQNKTDLRIIQERVKRIELANNKRPIRKFNESNPFEMLSNNFVALMSRRQLYLFNLHCSKPKFRESS
jgi:hypothetical protein